MHQEIQSSLLSPMVEPLLHWYEEQARILPWREHPDPYHVWISEIMLQQTRVEAVKPYYERFLRALPDIPALAQAGEEPLMKLWEGLGYYSRVRNLQKAARIIVKEYDGRLPADFSLLQKLPGIGPYTAGAIASIAYGIPAPAVDGNVLRVVSRLCASRADISNPKVKKMVEQAILEILPPSRPGDFNQALMELGAMVCLPNGVAKCEHCPLSYLCQAYQQGIVMELPVKTPKKPRTIQQKTVIVLFCENRTALRKRPSSGLLAGMWELPNFEGILSKEEVISILESQGGEISALYSLHPAKHIFTHIEWHMTGYAVILKQMIENDEWEWVDLFQLQNQYALPGAFQVYTQFICNELSEGSLSQQANK